MDDDGEGSCLEAVAAFGFDQDVEGICRFVETVLHVRDHLGLVGFVIVHQRMGVHDIVGDRERWMQDRGILFSYTKLVNWTAAHCIREIWKRKTNLRRPDCESLHSIDVARRNDLT